LDSVFNFVSYIPKDLQKQKPDDDSRVIFLNMRTSRTKESNILESSWCYASVPQSLAKVLSDYGSVQLKLAISCLDKNGRVVTTFTTNPNKAVLLLGLYETSYQPGDPFSVSSHPCMLPLFSTNANVFFLTPDFQESVDVDIPSDRLRSIHQFSV